MPIKSFKLLDGSQIPWIAFGTGTALYNKPCTEQCKLALSVGLHHLDAAQMYANEECVGDAIASSGIPREQLYVTTKLSAIPPGQTVEDTLRVSLQKLKMSYVDLFLVHVPTQHLNREGGLKKVWKEMVDVKQKGLTKSIGVSNFNKAFLQEVINAGLEKPVVNQIEYHPLVEKRLSPLFAYMQEHGIVAESYGSLSPILPDRIAKADEKVKPALVKLTQTLEALAKTRGSSVTTNQIIFKWLEKQQVVAVTTSSKESRLKEYLATETVVELSDEEMEAIADAVGDAHYRAFANFSHMDVN